jgi:hypothetical protein
MISFWQTDKLLIPVIRKYGCTMLDSLYLMPDDYTQEQVNDLWEVAQADGRIYPANYPKHGNEIASWSLWLGSLWTGGDPMHIENAYHPLSFSRISTSRDYRCAEYEREILKWYLSNVKENHFTVGDGIGNTLWDSMNRPDIMKAYSTFVEKVIVLEAP